MSTKILFFLFLGVSLVSKIFGVPSPTEWTDPISGTYFNFESLKKDPGNPWKVKDGVDNGLFSMVYFFNFGETPSQKCKKYTILNK